MVKKNLSLMTLLFLTLFIFCAGPEFNSSRKTSTSNTTPNNSSMTVSDKNQNGDNTPFIIVNTVSDNTASNSGITQKPSDNTQTTTSTLPEDALFNSADYTLKENIYYKIENMKKIITENNQNKEIDLIHYSVWYDFRNTLANIYDCISPGEKYFSYTDINYKIIESSKSNTGNIKKDTLKVEQTVKKLLMTFKSNINYDISFSPQYITYNGMMTNKNTMMEYWSQDSKFFYVDSNNLRAKINIYSKIGLGFLGGLAESQIKDEMINEIIKSSKIFSDRCK